MSNKPNFFVVGGPKCGTTAMVEFLRTHPEVFISEPKEINFFADNLPKIKFVEKLQDYLNLFKKAVNYKIIGDASIFYMFSEIAIKNVYNFNPEAKLLIMLRNPIDMVPSFHLQILFTDEEDIEDFDKALKLEDIRKKGKNIPKLNRAPKLLEYSQIAKYGDQLENIYKYFPKKQVKVLFFDDFKNSNQNTYLEVLDFLELADDNKTEFPRINDAKTPKSKFLNKIINRPPAFTQSIAKVLRKILNMPRLGIRSKISHMNRAAVVKKPISTTAKDKLLLMYKDDIIKTQKITNRDLSAWLS